MSMKNPLTPAGIEPAPFRIAAQHLNHCATAVNHIVSRYMQIVCKICINYMQCLSRLVMDLTTLKLFPQESPKH